ncbi:MAG: RNA methyltransferase [Ignavibacteriales bacterium]|nr:RNA methyltransferase [Ignavibacteriales bacterium]
MQEITSVQNPIIKEVHSLQQKKNRNELGLFLIEGYKGVSEAIKSNINIKNVFISYEFSDNLENIDKNKIYRVNEHILKKISTTETPPEIVASAYKPEYKLQDLFKEENFLILLLDNIKDPGNLGTIIRTAKASNVSGIILTDESVDIYNPKTVRSSAGNLWKLPVISMPDKINIKNNLNKIKNSEFIATAVAKNQSSQLYYDIDYKKPAVLMFGSEAQGLSAELINQADKFINIPMNSEVESLNLSVSVGVVLYEAMRQRQFSKMTAFYLKLTLKKPALYFLF